MVGEDSPISVGHCLFYISAVAVFSAIPCNNPCKFFPRGKGLCFNRKLAILLVKFCGIAIEQTAEIRNKIIFRVKSEIACKGLFEHFFLKIKQMPQKLFVLKKFRKERCYFTVKTIRIVYGAKISVFFKRPHYVAKSAVNTIGRAFFVYNVVKTVTDLSECFADYG